MATKIKDGLFIGDAEASQDPEFIELNKITFVINCAGHQLPNLWEQHGLHYLTFPWTSEPNCVLFDGGNVVIVQITNFIDEALEKGDSVLMHSFRGTGRCIACASAYLMFRHRWGFEKALDFLCSKRSDAAPNAGIVQQLYHLDVRLCAQWFGQDNEPAENERLRHDRWIPLVPGKTPRPKPDHQRMQSLSTGRPIAFAPNAQGKDDVAAVITDAVAGRFGGASSEFPSLGGLSEVQEEELVLVHSFLNSQPQIDALPPGKADYEDHVPRELHWIDRPRIDKLTAAGRLGANDLGQHMIPVSPRTGRAVPERPGNSSYNAMSRGKPSRISRFASPTGILKGDKVKRSTANKSDGRKLNSSRSLPLESEARVLGVTASGDAAAAVASGGGGAGGDPLEALRCAGPAKEEDEVIVEDLSEPRSDYWAGEGLRASVGGGENDNASGSDLSSGCGALGSPLSRDALDDSSTEADEIAAAAAAASSAASSAAAATTNGGSRLGEEKISEFSAAASKAHTAREPINGESKSNPSSLEHGRGVRDSVAPARQEERQAWEGSASARDQVDATGGGNDRTRANDVRSETETRHAGVGRNEKTRTQTLPPSGSVSNLPREDGMVVANIPPIPEASRAWDGRGGEERGAGRRRQVGEMKLTREGRNIEQVDAGGGAIAAVEAATAALVKPSMRRGGSEGSLKVPGMDVTKSTAKFMHETITRLPQAPGRADYHGEVTPSDSPDPSWGPGKSRGDDLGSADQRRAGKEGLGPVGHDTPVQGQGERGRKASAGRHYPAGEGGGSLLQLAQTPNPQQRRLPSPRPQQGPPDQVPDRRQKSLPSGNMFSQERPTSAPPQRPAGDASNGGGGGGGDRDGPEDDRTATDSTDSIVYEAKDHRPKSSSIGSSYEGYPAHGLMPSGSKLTANDHLRQRWREATSGKNDRPHASQAQMTQGSTGRGGGGGGGGSSFDHRDGGDGGRREQAMASGAGAGGLYSSTESLRLARMSAGGGMEPEPRVTNAPRPGRDRGSGRGELPREIRTSSQSAAPPVEAQRTRSGHSTTPPPARKHQAGSGGSGADFARPHRRGFGGSEGVAESSLLNGLLRQNGGSSLPLPSRKGSNNSGRSGDGGIGIGNGTGGDTGRWANPAPRGRRQRDTSASGGGGGGGSYAASTYSYPGGSTEIRGNGVPARTSRASEEAIFSSALSHRPQSSGGSGPRSNRAGGAQTYRSGSPAPGRSRRSSAAAAAAAAAAAVTSAAAGVSESRYARQQATHGAHKPRQHRSGIPPGFRGYIMQAGSGSGADGVGYETTNAPRSHHAPSTTTSRDRGRRMGRDAAGRQGGVVAGPKAGTMGGVVPRSFAIAANRSFGQRPSTTEGLTGDSVGGRRGRSSSPAPRPSSASGRRRSASPSPGSLLGTTMGQTASGVGLFMVPSFDRPRWK